MWRRWLPLVTGAWLLTLLAGCAATVKTCGAPRSGEWKDEDVIMYLGREGDLSYGQLKELFGPWSRDGRVLTDLPAAEQERFFLKYYNERLLAAEARARGLRDTQDFRDRTLATRYRLLSPVYKQREIVDKVKPTDEELYQYIPPAEDAVQVRIIVKEGAEDARRVYERAKAGEDFEQLTRAESEGKNRLGGGLSDFMSPGDSRGKLPPPVIRRFLDAPIGAVLEPFYQDIGFLVVKIEAKRTAAELRAAELERTRPSLVFNIYKTLYERRVKELVSGARVVIHDDVVAAFERKQGDASAVVLEVNGESFRASEIFGQMAQLSHGGQPMRQRVEGFVEVAVVGAEARRLGLDRDPLYLAKWAPEEQTALAQELVRIELDPVEAAPVTDEDVAQYRAARPDKFMDPEARRLRILVVSQEARAQEALRRLKGGADFASLVRELSEDPRSRERDGDMNFLTARDMPAPVSKAAFALSVGEYTEPAIVAEAADTKKPVWIIAKLEDVRKPAPVPPERAKTRSVESDIRTFRRSNHLKSLVLGTQERLGYVLCKTPAN